MIRPLTLAAVALAGLGVATTARADIVLALSAAPTLQADGNYAYTYNVQLAGQSQLNGTATQDGNGNVVGNGQFATLYDFGPMVRDTNGGLVISATGYVAQYFTFATALTNTPAATASFFNDDPTLENVRLTYGYGATNTSIYVNGQGFTPGAGTAVAIGVDPGANNLGTFTIESMYGPNLTPVSYDGLSYKSTTNELQANIGPTRAPLIDVPEPASMAILGMGLLGLGFARRRGAV